MHQARQTGALRSSNLGATYLRQRAPGGDPMRAYDALPPELRAWILQAAPSWSPRFRACLWAKTILRGLDPALTLTCAEATAVTRDSVTFDIQTDRKAFA